MRNSQLAIILELLRDARTILLFPHVQMDGDAFGSSIALCRMLRNEGKTAFVIVNEQIPQNLVFLVSDGCAEYCVESIELPEPPDLCFAIDCSDRLRIEGREELFLSGKKTACIDHHVTHDGFAQYNYIDTKAAATGEIVFRLAKLLETELDTMTAEAIYVAIVTDTGNFQYSNTTKKTHAAVAELYDCGIDHSKISVELFQSIRREKLILTGIVLSTMVFFADGKGCITSITKEALRQSGAFMSETEGIVEQLRNIRGVEIAIILKEDDGRVKVGMRSKTAADVAAISQRFGGGGHEKAAGCTIEGTVDEAMTLIVNAAEAELARVFG